jgi:Bacterial PH domain
VSFAAREHEFEAEPGLPEPLPKNERLLWQGSPDWRALAVRAFHVRKLIVYFSVILLLRGAVVLSDGGSIADALIAVLWLSPLAVIAVGIAVSLAQLSARTAVYTITDRRVVMRIGIVLTVTFNLPYRSIQNADLRLDGAGRTGDIALQLKAPDRIAYLHLWPHARPWRMARPEPMLRGLSDAPAVAKILSAAWSQATGIAPQPVAAAPAKPAGDTRPAVLAH